MSSGTSSPNNNYSFSTSIFSDEKKIEMFDKIANLYFNKNFGSTTKADFEILMFSFYLRASNIDRELLDSDYFVANNLGISDARVRTLKEKVQLKYPDKNYNWKKEFFKYAVNANFDEKRELIKFSIKNVNVIRDLRNYIIDNGFYDEYQRNPHLFQCPYKFFVKIGLNLIKEDQSLNTSVQNEFNNFKGEQFKKYAQFVVGKKDSEFTEREKSELNKVTNFIKDVIKQSAKDLVVKGIENISLQFLVKALPAIFL